MSYVLAPKQPKNMQCKHEEYGFFNIGPDDFGKDFFCSLTNNKCQGEYYCKEHGLKIFNWHTEMWERVWPFEENGENKNDRT